MFELEKSLVHAIVSKMIINQELMASLDEPTECMVMHRTEPTRLQSLSIQLSDKISQLVDNNERLLEFRPTGGGWQQGEGRGRGKWDNQVWFKPYIRPKICCFFEFLICCPSYCRKFFE